MNRQNIIITGASSGLGFTMAKLYAKQGKTLGLCARRVDKLTVLAKEIEQQYPACKVFIKPLDVNDHGAVFSVFREFATELGGIDRVIVNAGMGKGASVGTGYFAANKATAMTNFIAFLAQCEAAMEIFREQNSGHLVGISSISALRGFRRAMTSYAASKAGVSALCEGIRIDVLDTPINVTTIHPGFIRSEINEQVEKAPFIVDTEVGCHAMIKAIDKEGANYYIPRWPWQLFAPFIKIIPLRWMKNFS